MSGGQAGAENGQLTVMCGGEQAPFDKAKPVADAYAKAVTLIGPPGSGQITKMMNQMCIAGLVQTLSEALNLGQRAGLDMDKVMAAISKGAAQSWQMDNRWQNMIAGKFDYGFAVDWMRKDLGIAMAEGKRWKAADAGGGAGRPVLCPRPGARRRALGHVEPDPAAAEALAGGP